MIFHYVLKFVLDQHCILSLTQFIFSGVVFDQNTEEIQNAFKFAMVQLSSPNRTRLDFQLYVDIINTADAFKLSRLSKYNIKRFNDSL